MSSSARHKAETTSLGMIPYLRFIARRDRWRAPAWVISLGLLALYFITAITLLMDPATLQSMTGFVRNPMLALISGPGFGFEAITVERYVVGVYATFLMIGTSLMSHTTVIRHTRAEEESGHAELLRSHVIGRQIPLLAALGAAAALNLAVSLCIALAFIGSVAHPAAVPSLLFGLSAGSVGLFFAAVGALTAQLTTSARTASGMAGTVLALAFILRGLGDMSTAAGGPVGWLAWLSPLGWAQRTAPFTDDHWWPLLLNLGGALVLAAFALRIQSRRDLGAGLLADRPGRARAARWLATPWALVVRLQGPGLSWWLCGVLLGGTILGSLTGLMSQSITAMPAQIALLMGGPGAIIKGYVGYLAMFFAILVSVYSLRCVGALRGEESEGRLEILLADRMGRGTWVSAWTLYALVASGALLGMAGLGTGLGASFSTGDPTLLSGAALGHLVQLPALWLLLTVGVALYGWVPRATGVSWILYAASVFLALFGSLLGLEQQLVDNSLFQAIGQYPRHSPASGAILMFSMLGLLLWAAGYLGFRRRDLKAA
ncbi:ABC transporter permease [Glutamicibacter sp. PS]|uniref:ABC transporter permease n=1 Tax=Glutamicibacter sp. PS TaxID=3075634 RepID=UPI002847A676|nr:ABC transporter permease [Glutamicibacter sp. PS]MDR4534035.1 ABC transporter permease [Glutamicibacter sp. PS]